MLGEWDLNDYPRRDPLDEDYRHKNANKHTVKKITDPANTHRIFNKQSARDLRFVLRAKADLLNISHTNKLEKNPYMMSTLIYNYSNGSNKIF